MHADTSASTRSASEGFDARHYYPRNTARPSRVVGVFGHGLDVGAPYAVLRALNEVAPVIEHDMIVDRKTYRLRGFSFFTFQTVEEASRVVSSFAGTGLVAYGLRMKVDFSVKGAAPPRLEKGTVDVKPAQKHHRPRTRDHRSDSFEDCKRERTETPTAPRPRALTPPPMSPQSYEGRWTPTLPEEVNCLTAPLFDFPYVPEFLSYAGVLAGKEETTQKPWPAVPPAKPKSDPSIWRYTHAVPGSSSSRTFLPLPFASI